MPNSPPDLLALFARALQVRTNSCAAFAAANTAINSSRLQPASLYSASAFPPTLLVARTNRRLPAEISDHTLEDEERSRVWIYIHRQRQE